MSENQKSASGVKPGSAQKGGKGKNAKEEEKKVVLEEQGPEDGEDEEGDEEEGEEGDEEEDEEDEEESNVPPAILKRITGLLKLHTKIETEIDAEYIAERVQLEIKYREKRDLVYEQRRQIVTGEVEPVDDEPKDESAADPAAAEAPAESDVKGVPQFWLQALGNHPLIADLMQEEDVAALEFLRDISVVYNETYTNFSLQFKFAENPFFSNEVLEKSYTLEPNVLDERPDLVDYKSPTINWKPGKNLCVKEVKKKQKAKSGKNKGQVRTVTREIPKASFFHYFSDPKPDEEDEEDEEKEDEDKEKITLTEEEDFEIAHIVRTLIVPNAVMWFTGQAQDENYMGYDEEDDEDEDGEDGGEDDEEEDDDAEAPKLAKTKGGFAPAKPTTAGGEQPECKQN